MSTNAAYAVLGAYASLPDTREEQEDYYRLLAELPNVRGLELPYRSDLECRTPGRWEISCDSAPPRRRAEQRACPHARS